LHENILLLNLFNPGYTERVVANNYFGRAVFQ
jgi:hypothetical protein